MLHCIQSFLFLNLFFVLHLIPKYISLLFFCQSYLCCLNILEEIPGLIIIILLWIRVGRWFKSYRIVEVCYIKEYIFTTIRTFFKKASLTKWKYWFYWISRKVYKNKSRLLKAKRFLPNWLIGFTSCLYCTFFYMIAYIMASYADFPMVLYFLIIDTHSVNTFTW